MISFDVSTLIGLSAVTLSAAALVGLLVANRSLAHWRGRCLALESGMAALRRDVELMASISLRTGRQVKRIENEYSNVVDQVGQVESRGGPKSLGGAIDSARRGAEASKLTRQFGLSRGEAELVARLHGQALGA